MRYRNHWLARTDRDATPSLLEEHIRIEEELMFPSFEAFMRAPGGQTAVMRSEHADITRCLDAVEACLDGKEPRVDAFDRLDAALTSHNAKEERVLYPLFERHAPPEAYGALLDELRPLLTEDPLGAERAGRTPPRPTARRSEVARNTVDDWGTWCPLRER